MLTHHGPTNAEATQQLTHSVISFMSKVFASLLEQSSFSEDSSHTSHCCSAVLQCSVINHMDIEWLTDPQKLITVQCYSNRKLKSWRELDCLHMRSKHFPSSGAHYLVNYTKYQPIKRTSTKSVLQDGDSIMELIEILLYLYKQPVTNKFSVKPFKCKFVNIKESLE